MVCLFEAGTTLEVSKSMGAALIAIPLTGKPIDGSVFFLIPYDDSLNTITGAGPSSSDDSMLKDRRSSEFLVMFVLIIPLHEFLIDSLFVEHIN